MNGLAQRRAALVARCENERRALRQMTAFQLLPFIGRASEGRSILRWSTILAGLGIAMLAFKRPVVLRRTPAGLLFIVRITRALRV